MYYSKGVRAATNEDHGGSCVEKFQTAHGDGHSQVELETRSHPGQRGRISRHAGEAMNDDTNMNQHNI